MRFFALLFALIPAFAQTPAFEVASVKVASTPIQTKDEYSAGYNAGMRQAMAAAGMRFSGQRVTMTDQTLRDLVRLAYRVKDYQIDAPGWMSTEKFEIIANMPAGATREQAPDMPATCWRRVST